MHCRPLSSAELALVVGVLLGRTVEVPTAPATQTSASAPASGRDPQPCPDARACRNRGRELADGLPARWEEIIRLARQWEPYGGPPEEEIYVQFGLPRPDYLDRLARINSRLAPGGDRVLPGDVAPGSRQITGADRATGAQITRRTARSIETTLNDATVRAAASHHQRSATNLISW
jgi:hypothetical protein